MNTMHKQIFAIAVPAALMLSATVARAQTGLTVTLDPTSANVAALAATDQTLTFDATLSNTSSTPLYLNGDNFNVDFPLSVDDSAFQNAFVFPPNGVQPTLAANSSVTVPLFDVLIPAGTAAGGYNGTFEIQGGTDNSSYGLLSSSNFSIAANAGTPPVTGAVPEASPGLLLGIGLAALAGLSVRRRRVASRL